MNTRAPKVSIGLPVWNGERYLAGALECLLEQDYEDLELIVSDNASSDATESICRDYAAKDPRIRYYRNATNVGAAPNYNRVFRLARGEFFKWASHDDQCHSSLLRRCLELFEQAGPSAVLVFSKADVIDEVGRVMLPSPDGPSSSSPRPFKRLAKMLWSSQFAHPLWGLIRSDALRRTRLMGCIEADHILLGELVLLGELIEIPEVLYRQRRHPGCAIAIHRTGRELLAWHDPRKAGGKVVLPYWPRFYVEYFRGIYHIPLSPAERVLCLCTPPAVHAWRWFLRWSGPIRHRFGLHRKRSHECSRSSPTLAAGGR
jgi:glycosyltransferase involved in cell wall biosynthesis